MPLVPKKNIAKALHDIKHNSKNNPTLKQNIASRIFCASSASDNVQNNQIIKSPLKYLISLGLISLFIISGVYLFKIKGSLAESFNFISGQLENIKTAAMELKTGQLKNSLGALNNELQTLNQKADNYGLTELISIIGQFNKSLKQIPGAFKNITIISDRSAQIANDIDYLKNNALQLLFNQKGGELISRLENLKNNLNDLENISVEFKSQARKIKNLNSRLASLYDVFDQNYLSINLNIYKSQDLINALLSILKSPNDVNILVLFQNPTEIRPAGGFIGSFAYIALANGSIKEIKVDDIYNADRQLNIEVAPPKELSSITPTWGARDANWFFSFPESAQKVAYFLENSNLFSPAQTKFDHVLAINTNVLKYLIAITGPIELPQYKLTINSDNFLTEIQREVEAGQDKKPGQNPKRILSVLTPLLIERLKNLDDNGKIKLLESLKLATSQKDIMAFSENNELEKHFLQFNMAGDVFDIPQNWNGDYLAVVNTNIAGGKTDAFINQQLQLQSQILEDGTLINKLIINRTHSGQNEKDPWYRSINKNYAKILLPIQSELTGTSDNNTSPYKSIAPANNLLIDPDLEKIEKNSSYINEFKVWSGEENGKRSISVWINTSPGKTKTTEIEYKRNKKIKIEDGIGFTFVFDKQSGSQGSLEYKITAPPGYVWAESERPVYTYGTQQAQSREIIKLTLKKQFLID